MPNQVTVTAKTGPDRTVTAMVLHEVTKVELELTQKLVRVYAKEGIKEFDLAAVATLTDNIASDVHTIVIST